MSSPLTQAVLQLTGPLLVGGVGFVLGRASCRCGQRIRCRDCTRRRRSEQLRREALQRVVNPTPATGRAKFRAPVTAKVLPLHPRGDQ